MKMRNWLAVSLLCGIAFTLYAQQPVPPPPRPAYEAPANAEVLKLLRAGMPESVVLYKIHAITGKFDTSADALIALKQAGATEAELYAVLDQGETAPKPTEQPPVAVSAASGPSLAESMQFIQDNLNGLGKVSWGDFCQDTSNGSTWTDTLTSEIGNVVADQNQCRISFHRKATNGGNTYTDEDSVFSLRDVQEIVVKPYEQAETEWSAKNGHPNIITVSTSPSVTALIVRSSHGEEDVFRFTDATLADRVAKALNHAAELCGGGKDKL
ncbi:MAG: hypothetical protein ABSC88_02115 [Terracidiphilus sp.]|jgi:hypothetical protein